jgi:hypothetical protein
LIRTEVASLPIPLSTDFFSISSISTTGSVPVLNNPNVRLVPFLMTNETSN